MISINNFFNINVYREAEKDFDIIITFKSSNENVELLYHILKRNKKLIEEVINENNISAFIQIDLNDISTFSNNFSIKETIVAVITDSYIKLEKLLDIFKVFYLLETLDKTTIEYLNILANILEKGIKKYLEDVYNSK